ncbi:MAG: hypothetical protein IPJ82_09550 [Lewinellaceae bacterium]|nr:hypothetical protein [Lewinellaceae bacterium]
MIIKADHKTSGFGKPAAAATGYSGGKFKRCSLARMSFCNFCLKKPVANG